MSTKKNLKSKKNTKIHREKNETTKTTKSKFKGLSNFTKNSKSINEDKILEKIEKYVDKNREKTSQEMIERKNKRPAQNFKEWDLEVMISRINAESKPKEKVKETSKLILYLIYTIIIIAIIAFWIKYFFNSNMPQIS